MDQYYVVAYYPRPPKMVAAEKSGANVRLHWQWDNDSCYTTRGWPDSDVDDPPEPKEIKYQHIWMSEDGSTGWTELTTTGVAFATRLYDYAQGVGTTRYYAATSQEYSGLESIRLSNVWKVTLDGSGTITVNEEFSAYPNQAALLAKGSADFWTTTPGLPTDFTATAQTTAGHYLLAWTPPADATKVRYYNIYYSNVDTPLPTQPYRIASVPVGTNSYLDWLADATGWETPNGHYIITSVDRYGNESPLSGDAGTSYTLAGPTVGDYNAESTNFTVTPDGSCTRTITPHSTGSGTFTPTSLTWTAESGAKTFTYTPSGKPGETHMISTTCAPNPLGTDPDPINYAIRMGTYNYGWPQ
jgi:hypothetical protein